MSKSLKEKIALGVTRLEAINDTVHIINKRFDQETGEELQQVTEIMTKSEIDFFHDMHQRQLDDLNELLKAFPKEKVDA